MGERGFGIKADATKASWESEEFPQLCETCLGDNPYVRMMKEAFGSACKICARPFTVFRWKPGKRARYKKTEICQTCARMKNVCQTCVLDLQFNLPVQVRDSFLAREAAVGEGEGGGGGAAAAAAGALVDVPESDANREWFAQQHARMLEQEGAVSAYGKVSGHSSALLQLARKEPYYARNRPHLCSFFARGECNRGEACPYLHEMPRDKSDPLAKQNIKDRYYGKNDPVARKMLARSGRDKDKDKDKGGKRRGGDGGKQARPPPPPPPPSSKPKPPPPASKPPVPAGPPPAAREEAKARQ